MADGAARVAALPTATPIPRPAARRTTGQPRRPSTARSQKEERS
jgi:hypothetical protein